jgi:hypothetical protein
MPNQDTFTLKIATVMSAETLENFQHSMQLILGSQSCINQFITMLVKMHH